MTFKKQTNRFTIDENFGTASLFLDRRTGETLTTSISLCDLGRILEYGKWSVAFYRGVNSYYVSNCPNRNCKTLLHRFVTECATGMDVDHIDGNTLNNTRGNLRIVTRSQNSQNRSVLNPHNASSGLKNINYNKALKLWVVRFKNESVVITKYARTLEAAKMICDELRPIYHKHHSRS